MATFVLVHGAWHGGWCWKRVRRELQSLGHEVFTPTLTGLCEASHRLTPDVDLSTHIADVVNLIGWEELSDVVLCGHSYGGCVISGVGDAIPERIAALVYLDAFVLRDGESVHDTLPPELRQAQLDRAVREGDGWRVPPMSAEAFNVNEQDRAWVDRQCTPQPLAAFQQPLRLTGGLARIAHKSFILASGWGPSPFGFYDQAKADGWRTCEIACGHDVMIDAPQELARELVATAKARGPRLTASRERRGPLDWGRRSPPMNAPVPTPGGRIDTSRPIKPVKIAVLTISDTRDEESDTSGHLLVERVAAAGHELAGKGIVRDDVNEIRKQVLAWVDAGVEAIVTTGGTGITGRDVTPEALEPLFDKKIDGFSVIFHLVSYQSVGLSTLQSRAVAGLVKGCFVFCLPGSNGAVKDGWDKVISAQLDSRHGPCNMVELMPRLMEA